MHKKTSVAICENRLQKSGPLGPRVWMVGWLEEANEGQLPRGPTFADLDILGEMSGSVGLDEWPETPQVRVYPIVAGSG